MGFESWFTSSPVGGTPGAIEATWQQPGLGQIVPQIIGEVLQNGGVIPGGQVPGGIPQVSVGATQIGSPCWTNPRMAKRRAIKIVRVPDPSSPGGFRLMAQQTCRPKKMDYCNPKALGRAARRLGGFQQMAAGVERIIQHALKRKGARRTAPKSFPCSPKKRCR
jgi:hypothetical protein